MKILFIGGTGIISSAASELLISRGHELYHLNRGSGRRRIDGVRTIECDIRNRAQTAAVLSGMHFDSVTNWITFTPDQAAADIELFSGKTDQFIFISSASAYMKPVINLPITEETPLHNPFWQYSRDKAECEKIFIEEYRKKGFPVTIVRPSHTYDKTLIPCDWGYTTIDRMIKGKKTIIHGDGTSIWVMTNNRDFAAGFCGLVANGNAVGETFHITGDELLTWNRIYSLIAANLGADENFIHIPSDFIARFDPVMGGSLLGDKSHSVIFDNSKIKSFVPEFRQTVRFEDGVKEITSYYKESASNMTADAETDRIIEKIISNYSSG